MRAGSVGRSVPDARVPVSQDELVGYFDQMIKSKHHTQKKDFEKMPRHIRNERLKRMLANDRVVLFPEESVAARDGLPFVAIMENNLRAAAEGDQTKECQKKERNRFSRKPRADMGLPPPQGGEEKSARAGATFDPKNFRGNAMLFRHLNEVALAKCRQKFEVSEAVAATRNPRGRG